MPSSTLEAVLRGLPRTAFLNIELKDQPTDAVVDVVDAADCGGRDRTVVSSFRAATIRRLRRARPGWAYWLNADDLSDATVERAVRHGCDGVSVAWPALTRRAIGKAHAAGLNVSTWTVRRRGTRAALAGLKLHAMCVEGDALTSANPSDDDGRARLAVPA